MTTLVPSFLDGSSSFVQITRSTIKAWMSLNFGKISRMGSKFGRIRLGTYELPALERLEKSP